MNLLNQAESCTLTFTTQHAAELSAHRRVYAAAAAPASAVYAVLLPHLLFSGVVLPRAENQSFIERVRVAGEWNSPCEWNTS